MSTTDDLLRRQIEAQEKTNEYLRGRSAGVDLSGAKDTLPGFFSSIRSGSGVLESLANGGKALMSAMDNLNKQYMEASAAGLNFGKDMLKLNSWLASSNLSLTEFKRVIDFAGTANFAGLRNGMQASANFFLEVSTALRRSDLGTNLTQLGFQMAEQNELLAVTIDRETKLEKDAKGNVLGLGPKLQEQMRLLGVAITANTDILGISREDQLKIIAKQQSDAEFQLAMRNLPAGVEKALKANAGLIDAFNSPEFQRLTIGMHLNQEEMAKFQLQFRGDSSRMMSLASQISKTTADANSQESTRNAILSTITQRAQVAGSKSAGEERRDISLAKESSGEYGAGRLAQLESDRRILAVIDVVKDAQAKGLDVNKELTNFYKSSKENAEKGLYKTGTSTKDLTPGEQSSLLIQEAMARQQDIQATMAKSVEMINNTYVAKAQELVDKAATALSANGIFGQESQLKVARSLIKSSEVFWDFVFGDTTAKDVANTLKNQYGNLWNYMEKHIDEIRNSGRVDEKNPRSEGSPGIPSFLNSGSNFSNIFENFGNGTPATLHGMEAVVRPEQLMGIVNKMAGEAVNVASKAQKEIQTIASPSAPPINEQDFVEMKQLLAQLNTFMSHLPEIASNTDKQIRALKDLHPDLHA